MCQPTNQQKVGRYLYPDFYTFFSRFLFQAICGRQNYDRTAETKQNLLCERKSALETALRNVDFRRKKVKRLIRRQRQGRQQGDDDLYEGPVIRYVLPKTKVGVVLVLDISQKMRPRRWLKVRDAVFRLTSSLPQGESSFGVVTFDGVSARVNVRPTVVRGDNRAGLLGRVPHRLSSDRGPGCVVCGLEAAMDVLGEASSIVLVSASGIKGLEAKRRMRELRLTIDLEAIPLHLITFDDLDDGEEHLPIKLTQYGSRFSLPSASDSVLLQRLSTTFIEILRRVGGPEITLTHSREWRWDGRQIRGTFRVEESLRKDLWFVLTGPSKEDVESLNITSPSGRRLSFPMYDHGIVYFRLEGPNESGIWSYSTHLHHAVENGAVVSMQVFGEQSQVEGVDEPVKVEAWTNVERGVATNGTIIVYAKVSQDRLPVLDAKVVTHVDGPGLFGPIEIELTDFGSGYPDITANDGIYSGYLLDYASEKGFYSFRVEASNNEGKAKISNPYNNGDNVCCGSKFPSGFSIPTREFTRFAQADSVFVDFAAKYVVKSDKPEMEDVFPPARITDLAVVSTSNTSLAVELTWTATGDDFTRGRAAYYELRLFTSSESLLRNDGSLAHESAMPAPAEAGLRQSAVVTLPYANHVFYYAVNAVDENGNVGKISNAVSVYVVEISTTTEMQMSFVIVNGEERDSNLLQREVIDRETMVYLIAAAIAAFVIILSVIFFVAVCRSKKRSKRLEADESETKSDVNGLQQQQSRPPQTFSVASTVPEMSPDFKTSFDAWKSNGNADFDIFGGSHFPMGNSGPTSWAYNNSNNYSVLPNQYTSLTTSLAHPVTTTAAATTSNNVIGLPLNDVFVNTSSEASNNSNSPTDVYYANSGSKVSGEKQQRGESSSGTTASTDCSEDSDHNSDKNVYNVPSSRVTVGGKKSSMKNPDNNNRATQVLSAAERKRRQESLV